MVVLPALIHTWHLNLYRSVIVTFTASRQLGSTVALPSFLPLLYFLYCVSRVAPSLYGHCCAEEGRLVGERDASLINYVLSSHYRWTVVEMLL